MQDQNEGPAGPTTATRLYHAFGPIVGALILDAADFVTFGPVGLYCGVLVGGLIGWWLGSFYAFDRTTRLVVVALAAAYTTIPMTEFIPLATIVSAIARYRAPER